MEADGNKIIDIVSSEWAQTAMDSKKRLAILVEENERLYEDNQKSQEEKEELQKENQNLKQAIADKDKQNNEVESAE